MTAKSGDDIAEATLTMQLPSQHLPWRRCGEDVGRAISKGHANMTSCPGAHMHASKIEKGSHNECH
jgi:hypothetical protein